MITCDKYKIKHIPKRNILKTQNTSQNQGESWISNISVLFQNHHQTNWSDHGFEIKPKYYWFNFRLDFDSYSEFWRCSSSEYVLYCISSNCRLALASTCDKRECDLISHVENFHMWFFIFSCFSNVQVSNIVWFHACGLAVIRMCFTCVHFWNNFTRSNFSREIWHVEFS